MSKIKLTISLFILALFAASPAFASVLSIQSLPAYINYNSFKLSCTSDGASAQFYFEKNGGGFSAFGPAINLATNPCQIQVNNLQITEEGNYRFKVNVDGADSAVVSTIYDNSGPGAVSGYYKESMGDGFRIHWTNPSDSDFAKVIIYRGESADFPADSSHQVTEIVSGAGSAMTYENHFSVDSSKSYFYDLRAVDKAGNSSALVGDGGGTTTVVTTPTPRPGTGGAVTQLPTQQGSGSVLGTEATPIGSPDTTVGQSSPNVSTGGALKWVLTHKKISLGVAAILAVLGYAFYTMSKRNK